MKEHYSNTKKNTPCLLVQATEERPPISKSNSAPRRGRLVDYTQSRRHGDTPSKANIFKAATEHPRKALSVMGLPSCYDLEASLSDSNSSMVNEDTEEDEEQKTEDRIDFYLKVPKHRRKLSRRISTLDALPEQVVAQSAINIVIQSAAKTIATRKKKHRRSSSTPIPSTIYTTLSLMSSDPIDDILLHSGSLQHAAMG